MARRLDLDPRKNTRTTYVKGYERPFLAPFHLNYHLEHPLRSDVPCYHLKAFQEFLKGRGVYEDTVFPRGYVELFAGAVRD